MWGHTISELDGGTSLVHLQCTSQYSSPCILHGVQPSSLHQPAHLVHVGSLLASFHSHSRCLTLTHSLSLSLSHSHSLSLTLTPSLSLPHSHSLPPSLPPSSSLPPSLSLAHSPSLTHTHHTHITHSQSHSLPVHARTYTHTHKLTHHHPSITLMAFLCSLDGRTLDGKMRPAIHSLVETNFDLLTFYMTFDLTGSKVKIAACFFWLIPAHLGLTWSLSSCAWVAMRPCPIATCFLKLEKFLAFRVLELSFLVLASLLLLTCSII